ncbi:MAG: hypothetical protein AB4426_25850 [Xenococcaceae cyanobacterium]
MTIRLFIPLMLALALVSCSLNQETSPQQSEPVQQSESFQQSESPQQGLQAIIALYSNSDFDSLVRTRYAEISKAESENEVKALIERFRTRYQDSGKLSQVIAIYEEALTIEPEVSPDGNVATFNLKNGFIKLSKMENGLWGFHL